MRKVSLGAVAVDAGVSRATVDRVLNRRGGVSVDKEAAVLKSARTLGLDRNLKALRAKALRVCVLMKSPRHNPFYVQLGRGFKEANLLFGDYGVTAYVNHIDALAPAAIRRQLIEVAKDYDALVLVVPETRIIIDALRPIALTVPVVTLSTDLQIDAPHYYVGPVNVAAGRLAGELIGRLVGPAGGGILLVAGLDGFSSHRDREAGFLAVLAERFANCGVRVRINSNDRGDLVATQVADAVARGPSIRGIYNIAQGNQEIVERLAATRAGRDIVFICHDLTPVTRSLLLGGGIDAVIDQNPMLQARRAIEAILQHYGRIDGMPIGPTPIHAVFRENAAEQAY